MAGIEVSQLVKYALLILRKVVEDLIFTQLKKPDLVEPPRQMSLQCHLPELNGGIIYTDAKQHPRIRKQLSYAFSQRALEGQVPLIQSHIDTLIAQLRIRAKSCIPVQISDWFNYASFDIIGHLVYGEPFCCLETGEYHPYASLVLEGLKSGLFASACNRYGLLPYAMLLMPAEMARKRMAFLAMSLDMT